MIKLDKIKFSYRKGKPLFDYLTFEVPKGEFTIISGSSRSGKTTLLNLMQFKILPDDGVVSVAGFSSDNINRKKLTSFRRKTGFIFQDFRLIDEMTVFDNVALALKVRENYNSQQKKAVYKVLADIGIDYLMHSVPAELSGGEKQKVAIARALVGKPLLLMADEPTGSLDIQAGREIVELLKRINIGGTTIVLASHNAELFADNRFIIYNISDGGLKRVVRNGH